MVGDERYDIILVFTCHAIEEMNRKGMWRDSKSREWISFTVHTWRAVKQIIMSAHRINVHKIIRWHFFLQLSCAGYKQENISCSAHEMKKVSSGDNLGNVIREPYFSSLERTFSFLFLIQTLQRRERRLTPL